MSFDVPVFEDEIQEDVENFNLMIIGIPQSGRVTTVQPTVATVAITDTTGELLYIHVCDQICKNPHVNACL